jgi:AcrR family transcriptional regulator
LIDEAATEVFTRHGYDSATLQEIAAAAGVVASVIYLHYRSKEELYLKLLEEHSRTLRERTIRRPRSGNLRKELEQVIDGFFSTLEEDTFLWRTMFRDSPSEPTIAAAHARLQAKASAAITAVLEGEVASTRRGRTADGPKSSMVAEMVSAALNGLAHWRWDHSEVERGVVVETATDLLWGGLSRLK